MAGEILAAQMTERALTVHQIPPTRIRQADGSAITGTEVGGGMNFDLTTNVLLLQGEVANNETETSVFTFQHTLPPRYMAAGDISLRLICNNLGAGTQTSCTITATAHLSNRNGAAGANLVTGGAQTHANKAEWFEKVFPITATGLVAGNTLNISVDVTNISGAVSDLVWTCDEVAMLLDLQG